MKKKQFYAEIALGIGWGILGGGLISLEFGFFSLLPLKVIRPKFSLKLDLTVFSK